MWQQLKPRLLAWLFAASVAMSIASLLCWRPSHSTSYAITRTSPTWQFDLRLHKGAICFTSRPTAIKGTTTTIETSAQRMTSADPWPDFSMSSPYAPGDNGLSPISYHCDPDDAAFLGFNIISRPTFDLLAIPFWSIIALAGFYQAWWLLHGRTLRRRFGRGCCTQCGYNLQGLASAGSERCPECGHRFSWGIVAPAPPSTPLAKKHLLVPSPNERPHDEVVGDSGRDVQRADDNAEPSAGVERHRPHDRRTDRVSPA
jgi:hypothetical protein